VSRPPKGCRNPDRYQEPLGELQASRDDAQRLLDAAIVELRSNPARQHALAFAFFADAEYRARLQDARRKYPTAARANEAVSTQKSLIKKWFSEAPFYETPPSDIDAEQDLRPWFARLRDEARSNVTGEPLSNQYVRTVAQFARSVFERAGVSPNPMDAIELPSKSPPQIPFLPIADQRRLLRLDAIPLAERVMIGCGLGTGVRVGELLSIEKSDVFLDGSNPHIFVRYGGPDRAPTKSGRTRRVELFEPGLGFWRFWMRDHYTGGDLVFAGPRGGHQKHWPEKFPEWGELIGRELSSHVMRHSYAVSLLSGSWGYEPQGLEFVQVQLGHSERSTTERYYGAYEDGTWQQRVRDMTGRSLPEARKPVTAEELLGLNERPDAPVDASGPKGSGETASDRNPRHSPRKFVQSVAAAHLAASNPSLSREAGYA
jgi:integrase